MTTGSRNPCSEIFLPGSGICNLGSDAIVMKNKKYRSLDDPWEVSIDAIPEEKPDPFIKMRSAFGQEILLTDQPVTIRLLHPVKPHYSMNRVHKISSGLEPHLCRSYYFHNLGYHELDDVVSDVYEGRVANEASRIVDDPAHPESQKDGFGHYGWESKQ